VRVGEVRDIFLNSAAIGCGLLFSLAVDPPPSLAPRLARGSLPAIARFAAVVVLTFAAFFHSVHLGYEIRDDEVGTFRSRYTAGRLAELSAARAGRWSTVPPPLTIPRLSRVDQFLTEGIEHVRRRNELWDAGDAAGAWHENRILEKYYAPVIAVRSYHARDGSRWPDEQRRNAELAARLSGDTSLQPRAYVSQSNPAPIYTWPRWLYWTAIAAVVVLLVVVPMLFDRRRPPVAAGAPIH
jgi:hypothetical protein